MALPVDSFEASVAALDLLFEKHELSNNSLHYWKVLPSYILLSIDFYFSLENTFSQNINYFAEGRIWLFIKLLTKPWLPLKKILQQRVNFILATKTTSVGGGGGKRDWSLAVPFYRQGSLWRSENISCIKKKKVNTLFLHGWGARTNMYQPCPQTTKHIH